MTRASLALQAKAPNNDIVRGFCVGGIFVLSDTLSHADANNALAVCAVFGADDDA